jgi:DNA-binding MarR family transcriptional regulator
MQNRTMHVLKERFLLYKETFEEIRTAIKNNLKQTKITAEQWVVLDSIRPGIHCADLAKASGLLVPSLSRMLKPLEEDGLIKTASDKEDGRHKKITLTNKGQKLLDKVQKRASQ